MNNTIKWLLVATGVLLAATGIAKWQGWIGKKEKVKVSIAKTEKRTIIETVTANGKIQPQNEVKISPDVSGEITELLVSEGQYVSKGQLLVKIRPDIYQSQAARVAAGVDNARANMANAMSRKTQADARFKEAEASFARSKKLYDQKVISDSEFEAAQSAYQVAKAEVEAAHQSVKAAEYSINSAIASLKEANDNLSRTSIFAPNDGTIYGLKVKKGERVVGTSQMAGTEMMRLADLNYMEVVCDVSENDIVRISKGDTAFIEVDAYLNKKFKGIVSELSNAANTNLVGSSDQVTNFQVKIQVLQNSYADLKSKLASNESPFRSGMNASVEIQTDIQDGVLCVPIESVTTRTDEEKGKNKKESKTEETQKTTTTTDIKELVFLNSAGKVSKRFIKTGIQDDKYIEVTEGLKEGDEVVTGPYTAVSRLLKDGDEITVVAKEKLYNQK